MPSRLRGRKSEEGDHRFPRYSPAKPDVGTVDNRLQAANFENTVLFSLSCFQYILVAGVFSIGPPYRKPMWTNGECRCQCTDVGSGTFHFLICKTRVAHVVPGCSLIVQCFRLAGTDQVDFRIIGTRTNTDIGKIDTSVGGHHQCGCICRVRTVDRTSCCGRVGDASCVATG